jgi:hypothetical protein|nr:MAG TPA: hypothetical protein [Caudoviricetes sp.]
MGEVLGAVCFVSSLLLSALWASHIDLKEKRLEAEKEAEIDLYARYVLWAQNEYMIEQNQRMAEVRKCDNQSFTVKGVG